MDAEAEMRIINIHEAKTHLSRLVENAANGEVFVIAKAGKPLVKVVPLDAGGVQQIRRVGFLKGRISVPDDFDSMDLQDVARFSGPR